MFTKNQGIVVHLNSVNYPSTANIVSSQFDGNSVLLANSKIDIEWLPVKSKTKSDFINIESSIFTNNQGIVVYLSNQNNPSTTSIVFSQFYSNSGGPVIFAKSSMDYELELSKTFVKIASSNFTDNIGGAIRASDCSIDTSCDDSTSVKIIDSIFLNNSESGAHGAVYAVDIDISESNFHNNSEGAIRALFGLNLTRSNFTYNINNNYTNGHIPPLPSAGGVVYAGGNVSISRCCFLYNEALFGGAIYWSNDNDLPMHISSCHFEGNKAHSKGVALYLAGEGYGRGKIETSHFIDNMANTGGGAIQVDTTATVLNISKCSFIGNKAAMWGGSIQANGTGLNVKQSNFTQNKAQEGGALHVHGIISTDGNLNEYFSKSNILESNFSGNTADTKGGAIFVEFEILNSRSNIFTNNEARIGAILYMLSGPSVKFKNNLVTANKAHQGLAFIFQSQVTISGNTIFCNNTGSLFVFNSQVNLSDNATTFVNNISPISIGYPEGGAITAFQSTINFLGLCSFINNSAENGGAILATDSNLNVYTFLYDTDDYDVAYLIGIVNNTARERGGGIYLYRSDLASIVNSRTVISGNKAGDTGGGIYAISSNVIVYHKHESINYYDKHARFWVYKNEAKRGGGIYMGVNAKFYVLQYGVTFITDFDSSFSPVIFEANSANYGGAIYVDDETNFGTCESSSSDEYSILTECFMQSVMLYNYDFAYDDTPIELIVTQFIHNKANFSGPDLFGGLLDRCTVSPFAEVHHVNSSCERNVTGRDYFTCITSISAFNQKEYPQNNATIYSDPVQLCFCTDGKPDCNHVPPPIFVKKGELNFSVRASSN